MFTGIVTDVGRIIDIDKTSDWKIQISTKFDMSKINIGDSIACSGVCLTVVKKDDGSFLVQASQETLSKTNIGRLLSRPKEIPAASIIRRSSRNTVE